MSWQPRNKYLWDFWFTWEGETLHLFYLQADKLACLYNPERRHNLASVGHAVLTEFGWKEIDPNKPALAKREGDYWDNYAIWTGSIITHNGLYYMLYSSRRREDPWIFSSQERRMSQNIGIATSKDLITWTRTPASLEKPVIPNPGIDSDFDGINWRDPYVIKDDIDDLFYAFICARPRHTPADVGGVVAYATSKDLENWQEKPYKVLYASDEFYAMEVPQVFWRKMSDGKWRLYLIFAPHWSQFFYRKISVGVTYYVRSQPIADRTKVSYDRITWENEPANLLCDGLFAGKLVNPETEMNPVFFGFQKEDEGGHFVGGLSDPKWAVFDRDGKIQLSDTKPLVTTPLFCPVFASR